MVEHKHPITPPPELVEQWRYAASNVPASFCTDPGGRRDYIDYIATQAARWGADQELEACCHLLRQQGFDVVDDLRNARRPKPPSLAEQALGALEQIDGWAVSNMNHLSIHDDLVTGVEAIRTALGRLKELENGNG